MFRYCFLRSCRLWISSLCLVRILTLFIACVWVWFALSQTLVFGVCAVLLWCLSGRVTVVLSPLTALRRQHEAFFLSHGVSAACLSAETSPCVRDAVMESLRRGRLAVLVLSPEQVDFNVHLRHAFERCGVALVVFDEAHTWLSWPAWRSAMARSVDHLTATPRMALTATLRRASEGRLLRALGMDGACVIRQAFFGGNLMLRVEHRRPLFASSSAGVTRSNADFEYAYRRRRSLMLAMEAARRDSNTIVYVHTRREADALARHLLREYNALYDNKSGDHVAGVLICAYHAGVDDRRVIELAFSSRHKFVVVATVAFGLGSNSAAVRVVIHWVRFCVASPVFFVRFSRHIAVLFCRLAL